MQYVDGYNVCFTLDLGGDSLEEERETLLSLLKGQPLIVVFDAPEFSRTHRGELEIVYSDNTADAYILSELERLTPNRHTVVTADRGLADAARALGAKIIPPHEFLAKLRKR